MEMALDSESLLLLHVAPCSFRPGGGVGHQGGNSHGPTGPGRLRADLRPSPSSSPPDLTHMWSDARGWVHTPSDSPVTPKLQASRAALWEVVTPTSRQSSSRDQLLAWATYCRVAVMYASGTNRPPRHTWMFCGTKQCR